MKHRLVWIAMLVVTMSLAGWSPAIASGHTSAGTLPNGTPIDVSIDDPVDGTEYLIPAGDVTRNVTFSGTASIGLGEPDATIVYVVDVSGSTDQGNGTGCAPILVCEQDFVKQLNAAAVANGSVDEVGVVVFASTAAAADMAGDPGDQLLVSPTGPNLDTVVDSMFSQFGGDGGVNQFAPRNVGVETNYVAALQEAQTVLAASTNGTNIVVFVSDGGSSTGDLNDFNDAVNDLEADGVVVQSIAVGNLDSLGDPITCASGFAGTLEDMAVNGGECRVVPDPGDLPDIIPDLISSSLDSLSISVNGGVGETIDNTDITPDLPQDGPAMVDYATAVSLAPGSHTVCVTAHGTDVGGSGDSGPACVSVELYTFDATPAEATNELGTPGQTHTVTGTLAGFDDDLAGRLVSFSVISGPNAGAAFDCAANADCTTDASGNVSMTYEATQGPAGLGTDEIQAEITLNDPLGETATVVVTKDWVDTTPPIPVCLEGPNPSGAPPSAPGGGGQGQNQDGFYELDASDAVSPVEDIVVWVVDTGSGEVFGPFDVGTVVKYTQTPGGTPKIQPMTGDVDFQIWGNGDMAFFAVDGSGNESDPVDCLVPQPPQ